MFQLRIFGRLVTPKDVRDWLRGFPRGYTDNVIGTPSATAVMILDTPRALVDIAAGSFVCGLSVYTVFVFVNHLNVDAAEHDSRNTLIAYFTSMWVIGMLYNRTYVIDILSFVKPNWSTWSVKLDYGDRNYDYRSDPEPENPNIPSGLLRPDPNTYFPQDSLSYKERIPPSRRKRPHIRRSLSFANLVYCDTSKFYDNEKALQSAHIESLTFSTALQETIKARSKSLEADERLLMTLEKQRVAIAEESQSRSPTAV